MFEKLLEFLKNLSPSQTITVAFSVMLGVILWSHEQDRKMWQGQIARMEARQVELQIEYRADELASRENLKAILESIHDQQKVIVEHLLKSAK